MINEWSNHTTEMINSSQSTVLKAISSKLDIYLLRFCIILAMADRASAESCPKEVSSDVAERAIKLVEYFLNSTLRIYRSANDNNLTDAQQMVYDAIPVKFSTKEAIEIAARYKMSERAFRKFLKANLGILFKLHSYGVYTKLIV